MEKDDNRSGDLVIALVAGAIGIGSTIRIMVVQEMEFFPMIGATLGLTIAFYGFAFWFNRPRDVG